jgi:hypothetical protein
MSEFWTHYWAYLSDLSHSAVEITNTIVIDILFLGTLVPFFRRVIRREHDKLDSEHGFTHNEDDLPIPYVLTASGRAKSAELSANEGSD